MARPSIELLKEDQWQLGKTRIFLKHLQVKKKERKERKKERNKQHK